MSAWRRVAADTFPPYRKLKQLITDASAPSSLWAELWPMLNTQTTDTALLTAAFDFAVWCLRQPDLRLQVPALDGFYGKLPDHPAIWPITGHYLSNNDAMELKPVWQRRGDPYAKLMQSLEATWKTAASAEQIASSKLEPGQIASIEKAIDAQAEPWVTDCAICQDLKDFQGADLRGGESLPATAYQLKKASNLDEDGIVHSQMLSSTGLVLRCPLCGTFYEYDYDYEYAPCGGTSEIEWLKRIPRDEIRDWCRYYPVQRKQGSK